MALFKGFKLPRNQHFEYRPRFWDQEKEDLENRIAQFEETGDGDPEKMKERISLRFRKKAYGGGTKNYRAKQLKKSNQTLAVLILLISALALFFLDIDFGDLVRMFK